MGKNVFKIFTLAFGLCGASSLMGQDYNGRAVYDLSGPVKECQVSPGTAFGADKISFMPDGRINNCTLTFDWDGRAIGSNLNLYKNSRIVNLEYDDLGHLTHVYSEASYGVAPGNFEADLTYCDNAVCQMVIKEIKGKAPRKFIYSYSAPVVDDKGNWIERTVDYKVMDIASHKVLEDKKYTETRKIEYYE